MIVFCDRQWLLLIVPTARLVSHQRGNMLKEKENRGKPFGNCCACHACRDTTTANPINFLLLIYAAKAHLAMSSNRPGRDRKRAHPLPSSPTIRHSHRHRPRHGDQMPTVVVVVTGYGWPGPAWDWGLIGGGWEYFYFCEISSRFYVVTTWRQCRDSFHQHRQRPPNLDSLAGSGQGTPRHEPD